jgi:hypothetical protein
MFTMKKYFILFIIIISTLILQCESDSDSVNETDCTSAICTTIYLSITITIKHKTDSTLYHLTDYKVNRVSDNSDVTPNHDNLSGYSGYYPLANDGNIDLYKFKNVEVEFTGYVNNSIVIQKRFIVTADCCHISLVEGNVSLFI